MHFRPGDLPTGDPTKPNTPVEWEDNAVSNFLAWVSFHVFPTWCQTEDHWTSRITQYLFTDCPCCILFRGITVGFLFATLFWITLVLLCAT